MMFCIVLHWDNGEQTVVGPMEENQATDMVARYYGGVRAAVILMTPRGLAIEAEEQHLERMAGSVAEPDCS